MSENKVTVHTAFDTGEKELWFVDSCDKLPRRIQKLALTIKPLSLADLKALVYDTERKDRTDSVVDVDGWFYSSRRLRGLEKGLFAQDVFAGNRSAA